MAKSPFPFEFDLSKMMGEYQIPGVDWSELMASQQKNLQALAKANQLLVEGAQAVVRREVEILQKAMAELAAASKDMMQQGDPQGPGGQAPGARPGLVRGRDLRTCASSPRSPAAPTARRSR